MRRIGRVLAVIWIVLLVLEPGVLNGLGAALWLGLTVLGFSYFLPAQRATVTLLERELQKREEHPGER